MSRILFYISCGTLIRVRIIRVKLDRSLTGFIRTYINIHIIYCSITPLVFLQSRLNLKVQVYFFPQFYVHVNVKKLIHAFMHLCLVRLGLLGGGEKTGESKFFF